MPTTKKKPTKKPAVHRKVEHTVSFVTPKAQPECVVCGRRVDYGETYRQYPLGSGTWAHVAHIPEGE